MSTNNNKKNGNHFEEEFCELLALGAYDQSSRFWKGT